MKKRSGTHPLLPVGMTCERAETIGCTGCTATCPAEEAAMAAKPAQVVAGAQAPRKIQVVMVEMPVVYIPIKVG